MLPSIFFGFFLGLAVSIFTYHLSLRMVKKYKLHPDAKKNKKIYIPIYLKYLLNFICLFLVHKNVPMLIATAIGLTMTKNYFIIKYTLGKKGVS